MPQNVASPMVARPRPRNARDRHGPAAKSSRSSARGPAIRTVVEDLTSPPEPGRVSRIPTRIQSTKSAGSRPRRKPHRHEPGLWNSIPVIDASPVPMTLDA